MAGRAVEFRGKHSSPFSAFRVFRDSLLVALTDRLAARPTAGEKCNRFFELLQTPIAL
jgi:hypothetical protein